MRGTVKNVLVDKQFGFVRGSDGRDYFFHSSGVLAPSLIDEIQRGALVEFDPANGERGPRAEQVRVLEAPHSSLWAA